MGIIKDVMAKISENKIPIIIFIAGLIIFYLISKLLKTKSKREYHSEIKRHHDIIDKQLALSPTDYSKLMHRGKQIGKIFALSEETKIRTVPIENKKEGVKTSYDVIDRFVLIGIKNKKSFIPGLWTNKIHMKLNPNDITKNYGLGTIELDSKLDPTYFLGYSTNNDKRIQFNILDNFYKTMFDHAIDGMGNQAHKLAEMRDEWAYQLSLKDKEIERIREEKKMLPTRSR